MSFSSEQKIPDQNVRPLTALSEISETLLEFCQCSELGFQTTMWRKSCSANGSWKEYEKQQKVVMSTAFFLSRPKWQVSTSWKTCGEHPKNHQNSQVEGSSFSRRELDISQTQNVDQSKEIDKNLVTVAICDTPTAQKRESQTFAPAEPHRDTGKVTNLWHTGFKTSKGREKFQLAKRKLSQLGYHTVAINIGPSAIDEIQVHSRSSKKRKMK